MWLPDFFQKLWNTYSRKVNKISAIKAWDKLKPSPELVETILSAIEKAKESKEWKKDNGQFIPHLSTYLNGRRWEDEIEVEEDWQDRVRREALETQREMREKAKNE